MKVGGFAHTFTEPQNIELNEHADESETNRKFIDNKFDQVETELEAMFARSDSNSDDPNTDNTGQVFSKRIKISPQIHIRNFEEQTA